jgi:hypothetical protein
MTRGISNYRMAAGIEAADRLRRFRNAALNQAV